MGKWILTEIFHKHERLAALRHFHMPFLPEGVEIRPVNALTLVSHRALLIQVFDPLRFIAVFGEGFTVAEAIRQVSENIEVVTRLMLRLNRLMHRQHEAVTGRAANIVTLQGGGHRQDDIGHLRRRRPDNVLHDHRIRSLPAFHQPVNLLMMVERVAARPVDQTNLRIGVHLSLEVVRLAGIQQHIADARHRDRQIGNRVDAGRHHRCRPFHARVTHAVHRAMAEGEARARQSRLTEHRRQRNHHPVRLFATVRALNGIGTGNKAAFANQLLRQLLNALRRNAGDFAGPLRRFWRAVGFAQQIAAQLRIAHAMGAEEGAIHRVQPFHFKA